MPAPTVIGMTGDGSTATAQPEAPAREPKARKDFGPVQLSTHLGLQPWQWTRARDLGLGLPPDLPSSRWSLARAEQLRAQVPTIVEAVGPEPAAGAGRAAERLATRTGLDVVRDDIEALAGQGLLTPVGEYKGWPLYDVRDVDAVAGDVLEQVVAERQVWLAASVDTWEAADLLGWRRRELERVIGQRGLVAGRYGRWARSDIHALAADEDLDQAVRAERLLGPDQAATHLEIRRTDFDYLTAAGLLAPRDHAAVQVSRWRSVAVPLYRTGDLDDLRNHPGLPWEDLHAVRSGQPSPLREIARRPPDRPTMVRRWVAELGDRHGIQTWAWWHPGAGRWEIDWERDTEAPTVEAVRAELATHSGLAPHAAAGEIAVVTEAGAALRWARAMRQPGAAVILDTETTDLDGYLVEVAVIDAATGETLLDTLVNPGVPISWEARMVHGISDTEVAAAPPLAEVLPQLLEVTAGRTVLAYNAPFDQGRIQAHAARDRLDAQHLGDPSRWGCLMARRTDWALRWRWLPLDGGHRALGDCRSAHTVLTEMTNPYRPDAVAG